MDPQLGTPNEESRLFRPEAVAAAARRLQGNVVVPQPRLLVLGTTLTLLVLPALIAILTLGEYAPRHTVSGYLVPANGTLEAHLLVPSQSIGVVRVGQEVALRYSAFPYQHYGTYFAVVRAISETTLPSTQWSDGVPREAEPVYRVIATLQKQTVDTEDESVALRAGMVLAADIFQEKRPLWHWLAGRALRSRGGT